MSVACVGILVADCVAYPVERQAEFGKLELVKHISLHAGGSAGSTAYGLAKLGAQTKLIGVVGADGFGDFLRSESLKHGVDSSLIRVDPNNSTSATLVSTDSSGERAFLHSIGANASLVPSDVPLEQLKADGVNILHLAGFFILPGMEGQAGEPALELFTRASSLGILTSLDCVWDATGRWADLIGVVLAQTDIFCPSLQEAQAITNKLEPREVATALFEMGIRQVVSLKMGEAGSFVATKTGQHWLVPTAKVQTVDGTGCGDAFIAGFLAAYLRGLPMLECAKMGNATGAMVAMAAGATAGLQDWNSTWKLAQTLHN